MSDSSQKSSRKRKSGTSSASDAKSTQSAGMHTPSRRTLSKKRREEQRQRLVIAFVGGAIGLVVLVLLVGVFRSQVWLPSRPIAQVGDMVLTRRDYWQQQRYSLAQQIAQNLQFQALFADNPQISAQFSGQTPALNQQIADIGDPAAPIDEQVVTSWQNARLTELGAADMDISVSDGQVNQTLAYELGQIFLPPPPLTSTEALTGTVLPVPPITATETLTLTATLPPTAIPSPTMTPGGPTVTPTITETPASTATPPPTPEVSVANEQLPQIISDLFERYTTEVELAGLNPRLSEEDFRIALDQQTRQQLYQQQVEEALVPEDDFTASEEPDRVQARHILLQVDVPETAPQAERDAAFAARLAEAEDVVARLRDGADFAELAAEVSDDPGSRDTGGDVGFFNREGLADSGGTYVPAFVEGAFALEGDAISEPVRSPFGWHIIQVTDREVSTREEQLSVARAEAYTAWLEEQREKFVVQRFPEPTATVPVPTVLPVETPVPTFLPGPPTPMPTMPPTSMPTELPALPDDEVGPVLPTSPPEEEDNSATPVSTATPADEEATPAATGTAILP